MIRNKWTKTVSILLAVFLTATLILAGCGSKNEPTITSEPTPVAPAETAEPTVTEAPLEPVELTWYFPGSPQADVATVEAALNKILQEKLNITLHLNAVDWGSYDQKMQVINTAGEEYDLAFTASWMNNYYQNVNKGVFLPLDDILAKYAPTIMETLPKMGWDATKVNGEIYAIPNYQAWSMTNGIIIQKDLADSYGFDPASVSKLTDLEPYLEQVKTKNPELVPFGALKGSFGGVLTVYYGFDEVAGRNVPSVIKLDDPSLKVVNQFETEEYKTHVTLMRDWFNKGYFRKDAATLVDGSADHKAGKNASWTPGNIFPGSEAQAAVGIGNKPVYEIALSKPYLLTSSIIATMIGVSRTSKNPERAVMLIDLLFKDKDLYNLLCHGIEGTHYKKLDDVTVEANKNAGYDPNGDWMFGNQFNGFYRAGQLPGTWEATAELNASAHASALIGFSFDPSPVKTEIAQITTVTEQYIPLLETGSVDVDNYLAEFIDKLKKAGSDKVVAESQKQIDAWKATRGY